MGETTTAAVAWQHERSGLRAVWARNAEPVEWIAAATSTFVAGLKALIDVPEWVHGESIPWPTEENAQRELIAISQVKYEGEIAVGAGYGLTLYGASPPSPRLTIGAGSREVGARTPMHFAGLGFNPRYTSTPPREVLDDLVAFSVRAWQPLVVNYTMTAVQAESGRGGWHVPAGYRVWISPEMGALDEVADGLTARPMEGGTLLSVPDDWEAVAVAEAMNATLDANGLDEIPHPAD